MFPNRARDDFFDKWKAYAKLFSNELSAGSRLGHSSDCKHVRFCQFGAWVGLARRAMTLAVAIFVYHVVNVVLACTNKEMLRIATGGIVALVQNPKAIGDTAVVQGIREAMGACAFSPIPKSTIARASKVSSPHPTGSIQRWVDSAIFVNFRPEAITRYGRLRAGWVMPSDIALGLAPNKSEQSIGAICDRGRSTTATQTESLRVRTGFLPCSLLAEGAGVMPSNVVSWLTLLDAITLVVKGGYGCLLPTTAMAVTVRDSVRGMISHVASPFLTIGHATERYSVAVALLLGYYTYSIPQKDHNRHCKILSGVI